jgi:hypothetical protein
MHETGIGFAGIDGAWWLPAIKPFSLPMQAADELAQIAQAIFCLFDTVTALYGTGEGAACGLTPLLEYKVPAHIPRLISRAPVLSVRPDFQLHAQPSRPGYYQFVATELEICPSAHGFAHAMQVGYGLRADLVEMFARFLHGRELIFAGTHQWSEFLFEQLAFCRALDKLGARGRVLYDVPVATIADRVRRGEQWQPPMFGIQVKPPGWNDDVWQRIQANKLETFLWPDARDWPAEVKDAVIFRFGYFDCFALSKLQCFHQWEASGATPLNPTSFILDSKVIMAALQLPVVRQKIADANAALLPVLARCIPETLLLQPAQLDRLVEEKDAWVLKFAGFDSGNQAWGGRSLRVGAHYTNEEWGQIIHQFLELSWPVVAQRAIPSAQVDIAYIDTAENMQWMRQGTTRLRTFILRNAATETDPVQPTWVGGSHITVSSGTMQVSEGTNTVQAPVIFL